MLARSDVAEREFEFGDREFRLLAGLANRLTGIVLGDSKRELVYGRLSRRLRALGLTSFGEYCELVQSPDGGAELALMVDALTTNLTEFFREPHHFDHLRDHVVRPIAEAARPGASVRLRIWSAGCSSGEEPYSIAMTLRAAVPAIGSWDARLLATDVATHVLEQGRLGVYEQRRLHKLPAGFAARFTEPHDDASRRMTSDLRGMITFKQLNLFGTWPMKGPFDAIFCRNVAIYFDKAAQRTLFDRYADVLKKNGWLYIGHSENLHNVTDRFEAVGRTIYRRIA